MLISLLLEQILGRSDQRVPRKENIETFKDPKRGYITLYNKPLAALSFKGWGRTEQRHVIVYCSVLWSCVSENDSLAMLTDEMKQDINETETNYKKVRPNQFFKYSSSLGTL